MKEKRSREIRLEVRLNETENRKVQDIAEALDANISDVIRQMIRGTVLKPVQSLRPVAHIDLPMNPQINHAQKK
jgi:16S rRNA U516 pseudouridylate synthase RsuA-like enzyme